MTLFGTLNPDGSLTNTREIPQSRLMECPFFILSADHYRADGSCKCDDPDERKKMISEWEYTEEDFKDIPLRGSVPVDPEVIKDRYEARILDLMGKWKSVLEAAGFTVGEVEDVSADIYWWNMAVYDPKAPDSFEDSIDVRFEIVESEYYEGTENGVSFRLDVTGYGGEIHGGLSPFNYSDAVWVDRANEAQVERRFKILEDCDPQGLVDLLQGAFR
jgi:hypothetical protein